MAIAWYIVKKFRKMFDESWETVNEVTTCIWTDHQPALFTVGATLLVFYLYKANQKKARRERWNNAGKDVVVLHSFKRSKTVPNLSPYVLKLETYLRLAKIVYEVDTDAPMGPKGKCPWITINGVDISDSQLIIERLGLKFSKDFSTHLTTEEKGIVHAMAIMAAEHIYWGICHLYDIEDTNRLHKICGYSSFSKLEIILMKRQIKKDLHSQGLGRHSSVEIEGLIRKDLEAISQYLGDKKFLGGDKPCEDDCTIFAMLAQVVWGLPNNLFLPIIKAEHENLIRYCERMKEMLWPDWNSICQ